MGGYCPLSFHMFNLFFFKQKTAYEVLISDWSSDVCSSDLVLRATDEAVMYKRAAKGVALTHGCEATFMAKPFADLAGNGFHVHVSFNDAEGNNACASEEPEGSLLLRQAIGGMKQLLPDGMAIFAPNANSYRRFKANSYAPQAAVRSEEHTSELRH